MGAGGGSLPDPGIPVSYALMRAARIRSENRRPLLLYIASAIVVLMLICIVSSSFNIYQMSLPSMTVSTILDNVLEYDGKRVKVEGVIVDSSSTQWVIANSMDGYVRSILQRGRLRVSSGIFVPPKIPTLNFGEHVTLEGIYDAMGNTIFVKEVY